MGTIPQPALAFLAGAAVGFAGASGLCRAWRARERRWRRLAVGVAVRRLQAAVAGLREQAPGADVDTIRRLAAAIARGVRA